MVPSSVLQGLRPPRPAVPSRIAPHGMFVNDAHPIIVEKVEGLFPRGVTGACSMCRRSRENDLREVQVLDVEATFPEGVRQHPSGVADVLRVLGDQ